ncbi:MAG: phosphoribosylformylglycinamidine synthase subunit PurL, partial [Thermomicrobiales bacterium]|nr:phosphoribosylformylglycinamidine synthase subunit PurL [Thermomicrobiales bacterium]
MPVAPGQWREVALSDEEYYQIVELLGREPTPVELGMFGAMWSEHCGYKHSRPLLKRFPTEAPWVLEGPGENAGAVDVGEGYAIVFKVESHNHPSAVEPYQGAATGVGGIVRDIFTMGARPIAILDSLRFGPLAESRNRYLFDNVVGGIGGYGNCLGIPTVGGELFFDPSFSGNPLVNAMCVGVARHDGIMRAKASGPGNIIVLIGADTGRDGLHGATFASVEDPESSHRGVIQVGNPFLEKLLLEACLELLEGDEVVAMQDLGAAGLTSSTVECASRGGVGADIDVALVPRREAGMSAYEVMLSESQERMLLVVRPDGLERVRSVVEKWWLHAAAIGQITDDGMVRIRDGDEVVAEVPGPLFTDECPTYVRPAAESPAVRSARETDLSKISDICPEEIPQVLLDLLGSPNIGSRRPVFERYDHTILTNTVVPPGQADAAVLRIKGTERAIATAIDCNSRYCFLDPELGGMHAVAEATRNVSCVGATPLAITNCLNFGSPEKPAGYYQLDRAVSGMAAACTVLGVPVVSGNVSLYNETADAAVMPTPTVGAVGLIERADRHATMHWAAGDTVILLGSQTATIGGSEYLAVHHGMTAGRPPALDLDLERRVQELVRSSIADGVIRTAHDCSEGGLAVALAEMAIVSNVGVEVSSPPIGTDQRIDDVWFGEAASRIVITCDSDTLPEIGRRAEALQV